MSAFVQMSVQGFKSFTDLAQAFCDVRWIFVNAAVGRHTIDGLLIRLDTLKLKVYVELLFNFLLIAVEKVNLRRCPVPRFRIHFPEDFHVSREKDEINLKRYPILSRPFACSPKVCHC
jgi:hypothetical protein